MLTSKLKASPAPSLPAFPGLYRIKGDGSYVGEVVLATARNEGVVVVSAAPEFPVGYVYRGGIRVDDPVHWEFLPSATIEFSSSPTS